MARSLVLLLIGGCAAPPPLHPYFRVSGTATGSEGDLSAVCTLDLIFELEAASAADREAATYPGVHGGEIQRTVTDPEGAGFSFRPSVFGEVVATVLTDGTLDLAIPINATGEGRFWPALASLPGRVADEGAITGTWTCAPLDLDEGGYVDTSVTATGAWAAELLPIEDLE